MSAAILDAFMICPIGVGAEQVWAAVRAGISRTKFGPMHNRDAKPTMGAFLPDDYFDDTAQLAMPLSTRWCRLLHLTSECLRPFMDAASEHPTVLLTLPENDPSAPSPGELIDALGMMIGPHLNVNKIEITLGGRAKGFLALQKGLQMIEGKAATRVLVGGADSYLDFRLLDQLERAGRLRADEAMGGFAPGEGAAFVLLGPSQTPESLCIVEGVGLADGPDHTDDLVPDRCETLANAVEDLRRVFAPPARAETVFAGFNGEHVWAKEWGITALRHSDIFHPDPMVEHPADCFGDLGTAVGPALIALASLALSRGHRDGPALVFASSDGPDSGAAWLSTNDKTT